MNPVLCEGHASGYVSNGRFTVQQEKFLDLYQRFSEIADRHVRENYSAEIQEHDKELLDRLYAKAYGSQREEAA